MATTSAGTPLDAALSQTRYANYPKVRMDAFQTLQLVNSIQPRAMPMAANTYPVLVFVGTLPVSYKGGNYNIPVNIWLPEGYPFSPPICRVVPTADMMIKDQHKHVDLQGTCYLPTTSQWNPQSSSLTYVVNELIQVFSQDPPVRAKPKAQSPPAVSYQPHPQSQPQQPQYQPQMQHQPPYIQQFNNNASMSAPPISQPKNDSSFAQFGINTQNNHPMHMPQQQQRSTEERQQLECMLLTKIQEKFILRSLHPTDIPKEKLRLEEELREMNQRMIVLNDWIDANNKPGGADIDTITQVDDIPSQQLIDLVAEDATIDDVIYALDKGLEQGVLAGDVYIKNIRDLSRKQFFVRARIKKVEATKRGAKVV